MAELNKVILSTHHTGRGFIANVEGKKGMYGQGMTELSAIGDLVTLNYDEFNLAVQWAGGSQSANWNEPARNEVAASRGARETTP